MVAITFIELKVYESSNFSISLPSGCVRQFSENIGNISQSNMAFYMILSLTTRVFPVLVLCVTTIMLAHSLQKRRSTLAYNTRTFTGMTRTFSDNRRVTRMIFLIMVTFLVAEIQDGVAFMIYFVELALNKQRQVLSKYADLKWDTVCLTLSLLSYGCNFWIFVMMSRKFRSALCETIFSRIAGIKNYIRRLRSV